MNLLRKLIPAVVLFCIWMVAAFFSGKVCAFLQPSMGTWPLQSKLALMMGMFLLFMYLGVWLSSKKLKALDGLWPVLTNFPVKATITWTVLGIVIPALAILISLPLEEQSFHDLDLTLSILGQHLLGQQEKIAWAFYEEFTDRGMTLFVLLGLFARAKHRVLISIVLASVLFAFGHSTRDPGMFLRIMVFGCLAGAICLHYQSIFPGVGMHAMANATLDVFNGDDVTGGILLGLGEKHLILDTVLFAGVFCFVVRNLLANRHCLNPKFSAVH
jgi:hypothetical protein